MHKESVQETEGRESFHETDIITDIYWNLTTKNVHTFHIFYGDTELWRQTALNSKGYVQIIYEHAYSACHLRLFFVILKGKKTVSRDPNICS